MKKKSKLLTESPVYEFVCPNCPSFFTRNFWDIQAATKDSRKIEHNCDSCGESFELDLSKVREIV